MNNLKIYFRKLHEKAIQPTQDSLGSMNFYAFLLTEQGRPNTAILPPRTTRPIPTGVSVVVPDTHSFRTPLSLVTDRSIFVVDMLYRTGGVTIFLYNGGSETHYVRHGDVIAKVIAEPRCTFLVKDIEEELSL
jgi:dUTPase